VTLDLKAGTVWQMNTGTYANNILLNSITNLQPRQGDPTLTGTVTLAADGGISGNSDKTIILTKGIAESGGTRTLTLANRGTVVLLGQSAYYGLHDLQQHRGNRRQCRPRRRQRSASYGNGRTDEPHHGNLQPGARRHLFRRVNGVEPDDRRPEHDSDQCVRPAGATQVSTLTVNLASGTNAFAGILGGTAANGNNLRSPKSGAGRLVLSASNTYVGATTLSGGTLALAAGGSFDSSPTITVGSGGSTGVVLDLTAKLSGFAFGSGQTVKGIGTIRMTGGQALTINGTLAAGNSPGTLTVAGGDLVLGGSSVTSYEISGTDATVGSGVE